MEQRGPAFPVSTNLTMASFLLKACPEVSVERAAPARELQPSGRGGVEAEGHPAVLFGGLVPTQ